MIYVFLQYWIFVGLAFTLGLFVGWATCSGAEGHKRSNWLAWATAAFLAGLFLAGFKWIPGLFGHLLEVALLLFAAYILGCLTGCGCRQATSGDGSRGSHDHGHGASHGAHSHDRHADGGGHGAGAQAKASGSAAAAAASPPVAPAEAAPSVAMSAPTPAVGAASTTTPVAEPVAPPVSAAPAARPASADEAKVPSGASPGATVGADVSSSRAETAGGPVAQSSAAAAAPTAPPRAGMTDGQRSILAAKQKLALQRAKAAPAVASSSATDTADAAPAPAVAPAALPAQGALMLRPGMTDGQRSIIAARQQMAAKAARAAATASGAGTPAANLSGAGEGARPAPESPPDAPADDLKLIKGVGPKNEAALNGLDVRRFADIADWSRDNEKWVGHFIKFPGRIEREHWVAQAKLLAAGIETPHAAAVRSGAIRIDDGADAPLSEAEAAQLASALPRQAPKVEDEHAHAGARPLGLAAPKSEKADDLKLIKGIGRQNEERLHKLGVWHFDQIAAWTPANVKWIGSYLAFPGRIDREGWIEQAVSLARGELTEFAKRVEAGDVPTSSSAPERRDARLI